MGLTAHRNIDQAFDPEAPMTQGMAMAILRKLESVENHLANLNSQHPQFVSVPEFCKITGCKRSTVIHWLNTEKIKGSKIGKEGNTSPWQIPYKELTRYIEEGL